MRTIKFRVWDNHDKQMLEDQEAKYWLSQGIQAEYMQFTGLLDKKGREIYEGDVLQWLGGQGEVIYDRYRFQVNGYYDSWQDWPSDIFSENAEIEILGNIYENPELLANN